MQMRRSSVEDSLSLSRRDVTAVIAASSSSPVAVKRSRIIDSNNDNKDDKGQTQRVILILGDKMACSSASSKNGDDMA